MKGRACRVLLGNTEVGHLSENSEGRIGFRFARAYQQLSLRPVLGQHFEDDLTRVRWGRKPGLLPDFFWNLLPEGDLRSVIASSLHRETMDDFELLLALAADLPGAVELRETDESLDLGTAQNGDNGSNHGDPDGLRFSLAGVQLKFSMLREGRRLTLPARGQGGDWIVKIASREYTGLAENECSMLTWAQAAGFPVPEHYIVESEELKQIERFLPCPSKAIAIQRFDRVRGRRIHQEDFAQVVGWPPRQKYNLQGEQFLRLARGILGDEGYQRAFEQLVFTVAAGNADSHLKNWSLVYDDGVTASLSPVYDQVCTVAWPKLDRKMAMKLGGTRDFRRVSIESLRHSAERSGGPPDIVEAMTADLLDRLRQSWKHIESSLPMLAEHREALRQHWQDVPLLRCFGGLP